MLVAAGARLDVLGAATIPVGAILAFVAPDRVPRRPLGGSSTSTMHGDTTNYQLIGSLSSISNGGWFGVGPGAPIAKWGFLPEAHTDAIFSIVAEEMGVIGALSVIGLYVVLLGVGLRRRS